MSTSDNEKITVQVTVNLPIAKVWELWSSPEHIVKWATASEDWHTPTSENDLRPGGSFTNRMEAKDGSFGFDFAGTYDEVKEHEFISYTLGDGREVAITFKEQDGTTEIIETFDAENENPAEMQQQGWQAILDNFKKHAEAVG